MSAITESRVDLAEVPGAFSAQMCAIGETGKYINGVAFKPTDWSDEGLPIVRIQNLTDPTKPMNRTTRIVDPAYLVQPGDLLVSWSATLDAFIWDRGPALLNQHIFKVVPNTELVSKKYLYFALRQAIIEMGRTEHLHGSTMKHINRGPFLAHRIRVPPLRAQAEIVAEVEKHFSRLDEAVANLKRVKAKLSRYKAAVLKASVEGRLVPTEAEVARKEGRGFEAGQTLLQRVLKRRRDRWRGKGDYREPHPPETFDLAPLPEGWAYATAEQLTDENRAITYGVIKLGDPVEGGVPVLRSSDVRSLRIDLAEVKSISPSIAANYRRTILEGGEVVITVRGTLGGVAVVPPPCRGFNVSREVAMLSLVEPAMARTVALFIASPPVQRWLMNRTKGIAYTGINIETLKALPIGVPPLEEQERIVAEIERRMSIASEVEAEVNQSLNRALSLRRTVLEKAFGSMSGVCES